MKITNNSPLFTSEILESMKKEDLAELYLFLQNRHEDLKQQQKLLEERVKELEFMNAMLSDRLSVANRARFGASSEKYAEGYEQMSLFNEAEEASDLSSAEPEFEEIAPNAYKRKKRSGKKEEDLSKFPTTKVIKTHSKLL